MKQRYASSDTSKVTGSVKPSDVFAELESRQIRHAEEAAQRAAEQTAREGLRAEVQASQEDLDSSIEKLISSDPEEFVIRFLQTEGQ